MRSKSKSFRQSLAAQRQSPNERNAIQALPFRQAPLRPAQGLEQAKRAEAEGPEFVEGQRTGRELAPAFDASAGPSPAAARLGMLRAKPMTRLILILLLCCAATLHAKDYALIKQLPHKLSEAQKQAHKGWDSGNTGTMREATYHYNDTLVAMMKEVVKTYYPKGFLPADQIDGYLKALYTVHRFKQNAGNPTGEFQGTMTYLDVPAAVSEDLENTIADMVQAIVAEDPAFDDKQWKKSWERALKR